MVEDILLQDTNEFLGLLADNDIRPAAPDLLYMTCGLDDPDYAGLTYPRRGYKYIIIDCDQEPVTLRALVFHELSHAFFFHLPHSKCEGEIFYEHLPTLAQIFFWDTRVRRLMNYLKSQGVIDECND